MKTLKAPKAARPRPRKASTPKIKFSTPNLNKLKGQRK